MSKVTNYSETKTKFYVNRTKLHAQKCKKRKNTLEEVKSIYAQQNTQKIGTLALNHGAELLSISFVYL